MDLYYLLIDKILADGIIKSLKLIKYAEFIKIFGLKRKKKIKAKKINSKAGRIYNIKTATINNNNIIVRAVEGVL